MLKVLLTAPSCSLEPTGVQARVNDFLHYHRTAADDNIHLEVAPLKWDGSPNVSWESQRINAVAGGRLSRLVATLLTTIRHRDADVVHLTNLPPVIRWMVPFLTIKKPLLVGPNNTGAMFPESLLDPDIINMMEAEKPNTVKRWRLYGERLERFALLSHTLLHGGSTEYLAQSDFAAEILTTRGVATDRITTLPSGVRTDIFSPNGPEVTWPIQDATGLQLLYVGRPDRRKGMGVLLDALAKLGQGKVGPAPTCVVLGADAAPPAFQGHPGLDHVRFSGFIPRSELAQYYRSSDIYVTPSYYEAEPTVMIEALACGTPVIATGDRPFTEIGTQASCKFFPRRDATGLARAITTVEGSLEVYNTAAMRNATEYDIGAVYEAIRAVYRRLA